MNLAAEQAGKLTADRQPQTRASVLAAGASVRLLERLKDDSLFFSRNADSAIGDFKGDYGSGLRENRVIFAPPSRGDGHRHAHAALFRELEGVGK